MSRATERVLATFGATPATLDDSQRSRLDRDGYLQIPGMLSPGQAAAIRRRMDELIVSEGDRAGSEARREEGADRVANLVDKDPLFDLAWNNPIQLAGVAHVLEWQEFKLHSLNARAAKPGQGLQNLHTDWDEAVPADNYEICNSIWFLDDFTEDNGPIRVVPGSHRWGKRPSDVMADPKDHHPDEVVLLGPAGTCVILNSHVWHGGTANHSDRPRRALHGAFTLRKNKQLTVQADHLRPTTLQRLTDTQRYLLEV